MKYQRFGKASRGRFARKPALGLALWLLAGGCAQDPPPRPSIVLVVVDTLRADRLGHAGHAAAQTPAFDALAAESVSFDEARSTSSWTLPSTASLLLSQRVSEHGAAGWHARLPAGGTSLARSLSAAGYRTGMWTANRVIAGGRGFFEHFDHAELVTHPAHEAGVPLDDRAFGPGSLVTRRALDWIARHERTHQDSPFFAYLHFMEPHAPYLCGSGAGPFRPSHRHLLALLAPDRLGDRADAVPATVGRHRQTCPTPITLADPTNGSHRCRSAPMT